MKNEVDPLDISEGCMTAILLSLPFLLVICSAVVYMVMK